MIYLFTGQPGSQKTANMINFVLSDSQFQNRQVYFFNIAECTVPGWIELTEEEAREWYTLPEGSVILFDEAQKLWRPEKWDAKKRRDITEMETHRHRGFDMVLTTQHPKLIHADVRRQVQQHRDYKKPFGVKSLALVWEECKDDPKDYHAKAEAAKISGSVPTETFSYYKSTVLNTHKKRIPFKAWLVLASLFLVVGIFGYFAYSLSTRSNDIERQAASISAQEPIFLGSAPKADPSSKSEFKSLYPLDPYEYVKLHTPRVPSLPHTAPIYDELSKPTVVPKVRCYGHYKGDDYKCRCVTQQMTPVDMPYEQCVHTVQNGLWDAAPITSATYSSHGDLM